MIFPAGSAVGTYVLLPQLAVRVSAGSFLHETDERSVCDVCAVLCSGHTPEEAAARLYRAEHAHSGLWAWYVPGRRPGP